MTPYRQPPWMKIYLGHAVGTAVLGALLPTGESLKDIHALTQPILQCFPGAISLSKQAPDPIFAQVFLALSMLIAVCMLIGAIWHVSRGGYHTKTFENQKERLIGLLWGWGFTVLVMTIFWNVSYSPDGAETRSYFMTKLAISGKFGVLTMMNQLIVGGPLIAILTMVTIPFCTTVKNKTV